MIHFPKDYPLYLLPLTPFFGMMVVVIHRIKMILVWKIVKKAQGQHLHDNLNKDIVEK